MLQQVGALTSRRGERRVHDSYGPGNQEAVLVGPVRQFLRVRHRVSNEENHGFGGSAQNIIDTGIVLQGDTLPESI